MMLVFWVMFAWLFGGLLGYVGGAYHGWQAGVMDTEERWSLAVRRAEDANAKH